MSSYGMCPYVLCILHSTRFWYKRCGFAVINIDIISYLVIWLLGVPCRVASCSAVMEMQASSL